MGHWTKGVDLVAQELGYLHRGGRVAVFDSPTRLASRFASSREYLGKFRKAAVYGIKGKRERGGVYAAIDSGRSWIVNLPSGSSTPLLLPSSRV